MIQQFKEAFQTLRLSWQCPVSPFTAFEIGAIKDPLQMYLEDIYTIRRNLQDCPLLASPQVSHRQGKPFGLQLIGPQMHDAQVLQAAHAFEQATPYHTAIPRILK